MDFVGDTYPMQTDEEHVPQPSADRRERYPIGPASWSSRLESQRIRLPDFDDGESDEGRVISLSVPEFVTRAKYLSQQPDATDVFCKFVLNGVHEGQLFQVDPIKDAMDPGRHLYASRDYDSVLGLGKHIYLDCDVTIYPVCKLEDTLRRNIHIKHSFTNRHVRMK